MVSLIQCVSYGKVIIREDLRAEIGSGVVIFIGFVKDDNETTLKNHMHRLIHLRVLPDSKGKINISIKESGGEILLVPQFTLAASLKKGNQPSFDSALRQSLAEELFIKGYELLAKTMPNKVRKGVFGADMRIELCNLGPNTYHLDSNLD